MQYLAPLYESTFSYRYQQWWFITYKYINRLLEDTVTRKLNSSTMSALIIAKILCTIAIVRDSSRLIFLSSDGEFLNPKDFIISFRVYEHLYNYVSSDICISSDICTYYLYFDDTNIRFRK